MSNSNNIKEFEKQIKAFAERIRQYTIDQGKLHEFTPLQSFEAIQIAYQVFGVTLFGSDEQKKALKQEGWLAKAALETADKAEKFTEARVQEAPAVDETVSGEEAAGPGGSGLSVLPKAGAEAPDGTTPPERPQDA